MGCVAAIPITPPTLPAGITLGIPLTPVVPGVSLGFCCTIKLPPVVLPPTPLFTLIPPVAMAAALATLQQIQGQLNTYLAQLQVSCPME